MIPEDVQFSDLDRAVRGRLRTLSKDNAEQVGRHLVMTGRLLDTDPELAYEHAQAAVRRAGRVDVVREAAGLAAYRTGRFAEALRELRTVRRLNGSSEHLAVMADCERGLGRPERAIALAASEEARDLDAETQVELAMVVSGARMDMSEPEAALAVLSTGAPAKLAAGETVLRARVAQARAVALEALGRHAEAAAVLAPFTAADLAVASGEVEDDVVVFDLADDDPGTAEDSTGAAQAPSTDARPVATSEDEPTDDADRGTDDADTGADGDTHADAGTHTPADAHTHADAGTDTDTDTRADADAGRDDA